MNTNLLSCCSFPQIKFSFPLNNFHFLEKFCTVYSYVQGWSVFYHNKVLCSFPYFFSKNSTFFFPIVFIFPFLGGVEGRKGQLLSIELLFPHNYLWHRARTSAQGPGGRQKSWNGIFWGETCGSDMLTAKEQGRDQWVDSMSSDEPGREKSSTETQKEGHPSHPDWVSGTTYSPLLSFLFAFFCHFSQHSFSPLHSSIPGKLKKHDNDNLSVMEGLWEGLIAFSALFRCTNRPLLTIITQSSSIIQTSSIFHALNMSQAPDLSLIVQKAMQDCVWSQ